MTEQLAAKVVNATLNHTVGMTANQTNATKPLVDDPAGLYIAYLNMLFMAVIPIYIGSRRSVLALIGQKKTGEVVEKLSNNDAMIFPIYASAFLFGIFLIFKVFSKEYINYLVKFYFFALGIFAVAHVLNPLLESLIPDSFPNAKYVLSLTERLCGKRERSSESAADDDNSKSQPIASSETTDSAKQPAAEDEKFRYEFERKHFFGLAIGLIVSLIYLSTKHWITNNIIAFSLSVNAVELLQLNKVMTGCILLGGLFFYDIFWVFGTDVMTTVAKSFDAPIKVVFPRDIVVTGIHSNNFAMLGLGDIVIPGIFIALLLRFDKTLRRPQSTYFISGFFAYILGLVLTILVMHVFKRAQPALLYLVPTCLGVPIALALVLGDISALFNYEDNPDDSCAAESASKRGDKDGNAANSGGEEAEEEEDDDEAAAAGEKKGTTRQTRASRAKAGGEAGDGKTKNQQKSQSNQSSAKSKKMK